MNADKNASFKDKFGDFWYYNKFKVLFFGFLAIVILTSVVECVRTPKADFNILCLYTGYNDFSGFEQKVAETVGDINGDGKKTVLCENLFLTGDTGSQSDMISKEKLPLSFSVGGHRLYIMDREYFEAEAYIDAFLELDGILPEESLAGGIKLNGKTIAIPAENCPYLTEAGIKGKNLFVGIPCETDALRKQKYADASAEASKRLISEMVK